MTKMKVHELAKEIDKTSKEVTAVLAEKGIEGKAAQSNLNEEQIKVVKKAFGVKTAVKITTEKTAETNQTKEPVASKVMPADTKADESKSVESKDTAAAPVKKKKPNIIFVSNPHNSRVPGGQPQQSSQNGMGQNRQSNQNRPGMNSGRPSASERITTSVRPEHSAGYESFGVIDKPTPETRTGADQNQSEIIKSEETTQNSQPNVQNNSSAARDYSNSNGNTGRSENRQGNQGGVRQGSSQGNNNNYQGNNNNYQGNRQSGSNYQGNRQGGSNYQGNRPAGSSYQGNRPAGSSYQGNNSQGNRQSGSNYQGNRPAGGSYQGNNSQGNRQGGSNYQGNRPAGGSYQGNNYQGNNSQGNRQGGSSYQGSRPGQGGGNYAGRPGQSSGGYNNRPSQGGYNNRPGQGGRPSAGGGFDAPAKMTAKEQEKHRDEQEKRRQNQDKKRKDLSYSNADGFRGGKAVKGVKQLERPHEKQAVQEEEKIKVIILPESLTIKELAEKMKMQPSVIVKKLFLKGTIVTVNQEVTYEVAEEIAMEFEVFCEKEVVVDVIEELLKEDEEDASLMTSRPPVICVMGHVDHGKTSLLDAIRKTNVTDREAGGITQHIGAYVVTINGQKITFLDTPGHEAFTAMRMRGANATDIAILVVAADDGVMPQTIEAINHAKAAGIEIIVAVNKIDKPSANIDKVKQELAEYELIPEDWGGSTVFAPVSAKSGEGIEQLLEMILLTADIMELKANAKRKARGLVIEAELDKGRGPVATMLVQKGTLKVGDFIAAGSSHGKVRAMIDDKGKRVKEAGPSTPVEILGLGDVPAAGDIFVAPENDKEARSFAATFISQGRVKMLDDTKAKMLSLDDLFTQIQAGNLKELSIIIKADVQGSVEAVKESLLKLTNDEVVVKVIHGGVGAINESDIILASASNAIIIGFNVRPDATAKATAETEGVDVRLYSVIYKAIEDVEAAMKGMLDPVFEEKVLGHGEIRQVFKASGIGNIAGSYVLDGIFQRGCSVRVTREGEQVFEGPLASLKRFKDDVKEVKAGFECGLVFDGFNDIQELDQVEAYTMVEVPR